jgi:uncharacterized protein (DUF39 family)
LEEGIVMENLRTVQSINEKIKSGDVVVMSVRDFKDLCDKEGVERAAKTVDVVTCATFSPTCGVGLFMNVGHTDAPIKYKEAFLNHVRAYTGFTSVDVYIGSDQPNEDNNVGIDYSGGHVIQDLLKGKEIDFVGTGFGSECDSYPREKVHSKISLDTINTATFLAHRFCAAKGSGYINSTANVMRTYKGTILPEYLNCMYTGTGEINPLINDPEREIIGIGTRVLISGAQGYVIGEGTQHNPEKNNSTTMLRCDLRDMMPEYLYPVKLKNYATSMYVGLAVPIPILNEKIAKNCSIRDKDIYTDVRDAGENQIMDSKKNVVARVNYQELKSGEITVNEDKKVKTSTLSRVDKANELINMLTEKIKNGEFYLTECVEKLPDTAFHRNMTNIMEE